MASALCTHAQETIPNPPSDEANLTGLTTPVEVRFSDGRRVQGSGFFYFEKGPDETKAQGPHWVKINGIYVVTAKHVIPPTRLKQVVSFAYALRIDGGDHVDWHTISLSGSELGRRLHVCRNPSVDVAVVDVTDKMNEETTALLKLRAKLLAFNGTNSTEFPGKSDIHVQPGDDVLVIGYPLGFFDTFNKLPVLKRGLLSTPLDLHYNGLDAFLLDFKYYEGSSGSLVISKPTRILVDSLGRLEQSTSPQYVFLGVYSGEEYWNDTEPERPDLGLAWYYYNVEEAIKNPPVLK